MGERGGGEKTHDLVVNKNPDLFLLLEQDAQLYLLVKSTDQFLRHVLSLSSEDIGSLRDRMSSAAFL